jgi:RimJ/RimL family protein N-acetyltransferase
VSDPSGPAGPRFIIGDRLTLRRVERGDLPHIRRWLDDPELRRQIGARSPLSPADAEAWFERVSSDPTRAWYAIVADDGDRVIGEAGLLRMDPGWRTTDMTVIVGEPDARGKGYGTEAGRLLLDFAFQYMGFHRVSVGVVGFHEDAIRFWERLGFRREGVQRDGYCLDGHFHDFVMMSILEHEWRHARVEAWDDQHTE